jgi:hypothetical protein
MNLDIQLPVCDTAIKYKAQKSRVGQEKLIAEVKGIYVGLALVESTCITVDNGQD